jgi:hypothetical protein
MINIFLFTDRLQEKKYTFAHCAVPGAEFTRKAPPRLVLSLSSDGGLSLSPVSVDVHDFNRIVS